MRWSVEKRLEFIEFRLFWEGGINRSDIMDHFGVSVPQASKDLNLYEEKAPGNLVYDKKAKRYLASSTFNLEFLEPNSDAYLVQLRSNTQSNAKLQESWISSAPECVTLPMPYRRVQVSVLRAILAAIRNSRAVEIQYQSMSVNRPEPEWRWISPHAIGHDGLRWHVRSFCHIDQKFKDFILSRGLKVRGDAEPAATPEEDRCWREFFEVILAPNPVLSEAQKAVIAQDFEMKKHTVKVPVRKALLYYFQKRLRLDVDETLDKPDENPVVVANRVEFDAALEEAMS